MGNLKTNSDVLFILLGAVMVLAMHAGFAFLELGTVRAKNQVNALVKILSDFALSTVAYFFVGYGVAYGISFLSGAQALAEKSGYELTRFFFLLTFAARRSRHRIRRHRRARPVPPATRGQLPAGGPHLSVLRGHRLEQ